MKITLFYYSGAGNTKYIAKKISTELKKQNHQVTMIKIDLHSIVDIDENSDLFIVGFPIYDLSSPSLVKELVSKIKTNDKPIAYFCTKAFASADAIMELSDISSKNRLKTVANMEFFMPGTDALLFFAKKDTFNEKMIKFFHSRNIEKKVKNFITDILKDKTIKVKQKWYTYLSFLIPQKTKDSFHEQYSKYIPQFYSQADSCIECMKCIKECPRENIRLDESIKFDLNCDMCLHCVHHCPTQSIQIGEFTKDTVRYKKVDIR